jgi:hypothetical protein
MSDCKKSSKKLQESVKKKDLRAKVGESEGRLPSVNGRHFLADKEISDIIYDHICRDANDGIFHPVGWILEIVFFFILEFVFRW